MRVNFRGRVGWCAVLLVVVASGCAGAPTPGETVGDSWDGPARVEPIGQSEWSYQQAPGRMLATRHYRIHTTINSAADEDFRQSLATVMEGAWQQYRRLTPGIAQTGAPLECYVFERRSQWADFTARNAGQDAVVYLQITRGGYAVGDRYVAYYLGHQATFSVAAHEGWHQYVARHFKGRLPPFLEEGIACMFEDVRWDGKLPRWNLSKNTRRAQALGDAIDDGSVLPLEQLVSMHAGQLVDKPGAKIEAFYAQCWAFARFLRDAEGGKYRPVFQKLLADTAAGTVDDLSGAHTATTAPWYPASVQPMLEQYVGTDLATLDLPYRTYLSKIAIARTQHE
ncbi:MAG: hypothetical protein ACREIT_00735 [Tepidisphaeraceae bacterium]